MPCLYCGNTEENDMHFEYWSEGVVFILIFLFLIVLPCTGVAWIGYRMIHRLGQFPSKTPEIQLSIFFQLIAIELVYFGMIYVFIRIFSID